MKKNIKYISLVLAIISILFISGCKKQYTIKFIDTDGTVISQITDKKNSIINYSYNPTKEGYTFIGWDKDIPEKMPNQDLTITAVWEIKQYTITFDTDGGTNIETQYVKKGNKVIEPSNPVKEGYTFTGWYLGEEKWSFIGYVVTEDITLTAQWKVNQYTITFDTNGGNAIESVIYDYKSEIREPKEPVKEGYTFTGWYLGEEKWSFIGYVVTDDITLTAQWNVNQYTITFDTEDEPIEFTVESETVVLPTPEKDGYNFLGWYEEDILVEEIENKNYTLVAKWEQKEYTIQLDDTTLTFKHGETVELPIPEKDGYNFLGWYEEDVLVEEIENKNYILVSKWQKYTDGLEYKLNEDKTSYSLVGKGKVTDSYIVIPKFYNNLPVTNINSVAFFLCVSLKSIEIPNSVTSIGDGAFYNCTSLESIEIPNSITSIGNGAFLGCTSLESIEIPNSVTSIGDYAFSDCTNLTSIIVDKNNTVYDSRNNCNAIIETGTNKLVLGCKNTIIPNSVTSIGDYAFKKCTSLKSIEIPNSVTSIGNGAFLGCTSLESIEIPNSVTSIGYGAFEGCIKLESITIPFVGATLNGTENTHFGYIFGVNSVYNIDDYVPTSLKEVIVTGGTSIGEDAFARCKSLTNIEIPNSVTSIGDGAFYNCTSLESIEIPNSVTSIGDSAFEGCQNLTYIEIPNSVTSIGEDAFYYCTSLESIEIPNSVTSIGDYAFYNCTSLKSIEIPNSVTSIGEYAFYNCTSLESIEIPNSVTSIGQLAFWYCTSLESIEIPNSVTSIENGAFLNCTSLKSIEIPNSVTSIGNGAFYNCTSLGSIEIPNSVTSIGEYAFLNCTSLESIEIPNSVTSIENGAFLNCTSLKSIEIPNSVTSIGEDAFYGCISIESIIIPNSVTSIGKWAFSGCTSIESIIIPNSVTSIGDYAFSDCTSLTIYCEAASIPSGWDSNWNDSNCPVIWGYEKE